MENKWNKLSIKDKNELILLFIRSGIKDLNQMKDTYNNFDIYNTIYSNENNLFATGSKINTKGDNPPAQFEYTPKDYSYLFSRDYQLQQQAEQIKRQQDNTRVTSKPKINAKEEIKAREEAVKRNAREEIKAREEAFRRNQPVFNEVSDYEQAQRDKINTQRRLNQEMEIKDPMRLSRGWGDIGLYPAVQHVYSTANDWFDVANEDKKVDAGLLFNTALSVPIITSGFAVNPVTTAKDIYSMGKMSANAIKGAKNTVFNKQNTAKFFLDILPKGRLYDKFPQLYPLMEKDKFFQDYKTLRRAELFSKNNIDLSKEKSDLKKWLTSETYKNRLYQSALSNNNLHPNPYGFYFTPENWAKLQAEIVSDKMAKNIDDAVTIKLNRHLIQEEDNKKRFKINSKKGLVKNLDIQRHVKGYSYETKSNKPLTVIFKDSNYGTKIHELSHNSDFDQPGRLLVGSNNWGQNNILGSDAEITTNPLFGLGVDGWKYLSTPTEIRARQNAAAVRMQKAGLNPDNLFAVRLWNLLHLRNDIPKYYRGAKGKGIINFRNYGGYV